MSDELWRISAVEAVTRLRNGEISPLELVEDSARRIAEVEPAVNALPRPCASTARTIMPSALCRVASLAKPPAKRDGSPACRSLSRT
jgi:Asp-tRNA(Asn)/Glu-tRNA(Gln) amidotransferase A subunit family amidase